MRERTIWIAAGLLGLAVAVALAVLTSHVSQPPVGVPGEPVSAGKQLAPARTATSARPKPTRTALAPPPPDAGPPPRQSDDDEDRNGSSGSRSGGDSSGGDSSGGDSSDGDSSGKGRGRGRGRGGDD